MINPVQFNPDDSPEVIIQKAMLVKKQMGEYFKTTRPDGMMGKFIVSINPMGISIFLQDLRSRGGAHLGIRPDASNDLEKLAALIRSQLEQHD